VSTHIADHGTLAFAPEITEVTRRTAVKVLRGDNMAKVASRHGVTVANLARWNDMKPTASLRAGQSLEVYKTVRVSAAPTRTAQVSKSTKASNTSKRPRATGTAKEKPVVTKVAQQTRGDTPTKRKR